jgi:major membrane immunogen (membrane-anchored lipoprotein)
MRKILLTLALLAVLFPGGCGEGAPSGSPSEPPGPGAGRGGALNDGYYTAEAAQFDGQGGKEYLTIYVFNGRIVSVEYNSRNVRGFLRSWDMADKRRSVLTSGTNQSRYGRHYTVSLLNWQDPDKVDPLPGAVRGHRNFQRLAKAALKQARAGSRRVAFVQLEDQR